MSRFIKFGSRFDPKRNEIVNLMGPRELTLVGVAAVQAIWFLFVQTAMLFMLRLTLASLIGLALLAVALVPIKDKPMEWHVAQFIRYKLRPARRIYQTALRKPLEVVEADEVAPNVVPAAKPIAETKTRTKARSDAGTWRELLPDPAFIVAAFACLLVVGSVVVYAGRGGRIVEAHVFVSSDAMRR
jgi:hypothetical protein